MALALTNLSDQPMPAGLGFHPFFARTAATRYRGLHRGEWHNSADCLPETLVLRESPHDWWQGSTVGARSVDTVYVQRDGPLSIDWPDRGLKLVMTPSANLAFTALYTPRGEDWFCVEPVSHMTDAVNRDGEGSGLVWLPPGETLSASLSLAVAQTGAVFAAPRAMRSGDGPVTRSSRS